MPRVTPVVFVVDDDVSVRESLEAMIRCNDWKAETFASAHEFLARPRVPGPSCLILDVSLPDLNGLDLQTRVAADRTDMPIIFITGHGDILMTVRAMKAGAVEFLTKPFTDDALNAVVEEIKKASPDAAPHLPQPIHWGGHIARLASQAEVSFLDLEIMVNQVLAVLDVLQERK